MIDPISSRIDALRLTFAFTAVAACYFVFVVVARQHILGLDSNTAKIALWIPIPLIAALCARRDKAIWHELGLANAWLLHLAPGLVAGVVMAGVLVMYYGQRMSLPTPEVLAFKSITGPVTEEFVFRGFLITQLLLARMRTMSAVAMAAVIFGAVHVPSPGVWSSGDPATIAGVFLITAAGGALFGIVMIMSGSVLGAMAFHIGLNLVWEMFAIGQTAIGNKEANVARFAAMLAGLIVAYVVGRLTRARAHEPR